MTKMNSVPLSTESSSKIIWPPNQVKGIKHLNRDLFNKSVRLPFVQTNTDNLRQVGQALKNYLLKMPGFKPVQKDSNEDYHRIYLNPDLIDPKFQIEIEKLNERLLPLEDGSMIGYRDFELTYENFNHMTVFRAILNEEENDSISGFSTIGHIIHLNLRDHMLPYKELIGQVFLDKIKGCRLVVNKLNMIDTKFRYFEMETLASDTGEPPVDTIVSTTECDVKFKFDFAKVYWNPRLSAERTRILDMLKPQVDVLYDVFAGVGPFAVSAAKMRKCRVLANDLNPESYRWLCENVRINKVQHLVECFCLDGRDFIKEKIKDDLVNVMENFNGSDLNRSFHVVMNLPEIAFEFLNEFNGLLSSIKIDHYEYQIPELKIHCYCFLKDVPEDEHEKTIIERASTILGYQLSLEDVNEIRNVRKVAPNKLMYRLSFNLGKEILFRQKTETTDDDVEPPDQKRLKLEE